MKKEKIKQLIKEGKKKEINILLEEIQFNIAMRNIEITKLEYQQGT